VNVTVEHVRGLDARDTDAAAAEIASADIMATAVGANILPKVAPVIAAGLAMRWQRGDVTP
jgi:mannitol-1-phosphate 5-dehydrogenase